MLPVECAFRWLTLHFLTCVAPIEALIDMDAVCLNLTFLVLSPTTPFTRSS